VSEPPTAEEQLRGHVRAALQAAGVSQAEAARQLGVSTKHVSQMLTGRATLTLTWAEGFLGLCGVAIDITVRPEEGS
jgi:plasmid maintenance system antidote protein VapI